MLIPIARHLTETSRVDIWVDYGKFWFIDASDRHISITFRDGRLKIRGGSCLANVCLADPDSLEKMAEMIQTCRGLKDCNGCRFIAKRR